MAYLAFESKKRLAHFLNLESQASTVRTNSQYTEFSPYSFSVFMGCAIRIMRILQRKYLLFEGDPQARC